MELRGFGAALAGAGVLSAFATDARAQDDNIFAAWSIWGQMAPMIRRECGEAQGPGANKAYPGAQAVPWVRRSGRENPDYPRQTAWQS